VLEIRDIEDPTPLLDAAIRLDSFDLAVFVSPNAIQKALAVILARRTWPAGLRVAAHRQEQRTRAGTPRHPRRHIAAAALRLRSPAGTSRTDRRARASA
jgi:hypothetical protein